MNELNLYNLFEQIISKSRTMKRFVVAPYYGNDLNKNNLGEITEDVIGGMKDQVKYPICMMLPPVEVIEDYDKGFSRFKCKLYFLANPYSVNSSINKTTNTSKHTVQQTWKDMRLCAIEFRKALQLVTQKNMNAGIRDGQGIDVIDRVSNVANDKLSGVGISFDVDVFLGCELSDYFQGMIDTIVINTNDLHPRHDY